MEASYATFAPRYDMALGMRPEAARAKGTALEWIVRHAPRGGRLLDIGAGPGREAVMLERRGFRVVGIDSSAEMVELARARAASAGVASSFHRMRASELDDLEESPFDLAYSFYAVLNLEPRLEETIAAVARRLKPGAPFIVGLLNPTVLFELAAYPFAGRLKGFRKALRKPVRLRLSTSGPEEVDCYLFRPEEFIERARPWFEPVETMGLHIFLPPPRPALLRFARLVGAANRLEDRIAHRSPWNGLGYFSLFRMRRTSFV